jgi:cytochrome c oxidase subunit II
MMRRFALVSLLVVLLGGCRFGLPPTVTDQGRHAASLWRLFSIIALAIGALVYALVVIAVFRYRRRPGDDRPPSQRQYILPLEIVYTAIPLLIVGFLLGVSIQAERKVTHLSDRPDLVVEVIGFQWQWQFRYEGEGVQITGVPGETPVLVLPTGRTVRLDLVSNDVIHSFWVPKFNEKRDLIPRVHNAIDVRLTEVGEWPGVCSEFCGLDHSQMTFRVRALPPDEFDSWLHSKQTS